MGSNNHEELNELDKQRKALNEKIREQQESIKDQIPVPKAGDLYIRDNWMPDGDPYELVLVLHHARPGYRSAAGVLSRVENGFRCEVNAFTATFPDWPVPRIRTNVGDSNWSSGHEEKFFISHEDIDKAIAHPENCYWQSRPHWSDDKARPVRYVGNIDLDAELAYVKGYEPYLLGMVNERHWELKELKYLGHEGALSLMNGIKGVMGGSPFESYVHPDFDVLRYLPDDCNCTYGANAVKLKDKQYSPQVHRHSVDVSYGADDPLSGHTAVFCKFSNPMDVGAQLPQLLKGEGYWHMYHLGFKPCIGKSLNKNANRGDLPCDKSQMEDPWLFELEPEHKTLPGTQSGCLVQHQHPDVPKPKEVAWPLDKLTKEQFRETFQEAPDCPHLAINFCDEGKSDIGHDEGHDFVETYAWQDEVYYLPIPPSKDGGHTVIVDMAKIDTWNSKDYLKEYVENPTNI